MEVLHYPMFNSAWEGLSTKRVHKTTLSKRNEINLAKCSYPRVSSLPRLLAESIIVRASIDSGNFFCRTQANITGLYEWSDVCYNSKVRKCVLTQMNTVVWITTSRQCVHDSQRHGNTRLTQSNNYWDRPPRLCQNQTHLRFMVGEAVAKPDVFTLLLSSLPEKILRLYKSDLI